MKRLVFLLLSSMAFGQGVFIPTQQALKTVNGVTSPVANATVTVCAAGASGIPCTPVLGSALFKDAALTQSLPNPFTSDANGNYVFAIAPGNYTVTVTAATFVGYSYQITAPIAAGANNTFTGTTTFSGTTNLSGGGSLSGTFSGTNFFSGATSNCNFNNWLFNTSSCFSGSDIGAQFNSAYGAMPGTGTRFHVSPSGSAYSFTTPMVATNTSFSLMFSCPVENSSILTFTPTTGAALTLAGGGGSHNEGGVQVENCTFYGSGNGNTTTGLQLASGANGLAGATFKSIVVGKSTATAFGTGINFNNTNGFNAYLAHFYNSKVIGNNVGAQVCGEGINWYGGLFGSNVTGLSFLSASCPAQAHAHGVSFDDNSTVAVNIASGGTSTDIFNCTACHHENVGLGTDLYLNMTSTAAAATYVAGEYNDDRTAGGPFSGFVTATGGNLEVLGTTLGAGVTNTQAFNLSGTVNALLFPIVMTTTTFPNIVTPAYLTPAGGHGAVAMLPIFNTSNTLNFLLSGTGIDGASIGPGYDLVGQEAGGKCFRLRENGGFLEWVDCATRTNPGMRGRLVGVNFNVETEGVYATTAAGSTACTNGELALSAGWQSTGTATVTAVQGTGQTCSWTITTGTTTAANPTVTDTLVDPLPAATIVCEMNIHGGTHTAVAGEYFNQTVLSSTAPVFTFSVTPTAGGTTYFVTRRCGP